MHGKLCAILRIYTRLDNEYGTQKLEKYTKNLIEKQQQPVIMMISNVQFV